MNGFKRFSWLVEAYGPVVAGLITLGLLLFLKDTLLPLMAENRLSANNLFTAIFGWASIQTGCVFAIYGFIAGKTDGFIGEARNTRSMRRYRIYIRRAIMSGFVLTIGSIPLVAFNFKVGLNDIGVYALIAIWFSVFVWAFLSFGRVAYIFGLLTRIEDVNKIKAG